MEDTWRRKPGGGHLEEDIWRRTPGGGGHLEKDTCRRTSAQGLNTCTRKPRLQTLPAPHQLWQRFDTQCTHGLLTIFRSSNECESTVPTLAQNTHRAGLHASDLHDTSLNLYLDLVRHQPANSALLPWIFPPKLLGTPTPRQPTAQVRPCQPSTGKHFHTPPDATLADACWQSCTNSNTALEPQRQRPG